MVMMTGGTFKGRMEREESEPIQNIVILPKIPLNRYKTIIFPYEFSHQINIKLLKIP